MGSTSPRPDRPVSLADRGIGHVGLKVSNLEKSRKFYQEILGLRNETKGPSMAFVSSGSDMLVLYEAGAGTSDRIFISALDSTRPPRSTNGCSGSEATMSASTRT